MIVDFDGIEYVCFDCFYVGLFVIGGDVVVYLSKG